MSPRSDRVRLDLNNPTFQEVLFALETQKQRTVFGTLRKLSAMSWSQIYHDPGLKWEAIVSREGPKGHRLYAFRIGKGFRAVAYRDGQWLRLLSLHPDHNTAYSK
jgi:hypothetical protein